LNWQNEQVILITGSAKRIGAVMAMHLHKLGFNIIIHYHQSETAALSLLHDLNRQRPNSAYAIKANLEHMVEVANLMPQALKFRARVDVLINNASYFSSNNADFHKFMRINVEAPYLLSHAAQEHLTQHNGCIINITDIHAEHPLKDYEAYCMSKAAFKMQTRLLAQKFSPKVRVNAIAPGAIIWPDGDNELNNLVQNKIIERTLLKCHGSPEYIALAAEALINNKFITGQTINVDGGRY
jgi:pteridine reductase